MTIRYRARRTDSGTVNIATITHKLQPTRNPGGRYTLAWGVAENGTIYRTQQPRGARPPWRQATTAEAVAAPSAVAIAALDAADAALRAAHAALRAARANALGAADAALRAARAALREAHAAFRRDAADAKFALGALDAYNDARAARANAADAAHAALRAARDADDARS